MVSTGIVKRGRFLLSFKFAHVMTRQSRLSTTVNRFMVPTIIILASVLVTRISRTTSKWRRSFEREPSASDERSSTAKTTNLNPKYGAVFEMIEYMSVPQAYMAGANKLGEIPRMPAVFESASSGEIG